MNKNTSGYRNIVLISQISISIMVPTFLCVAIGLYIDKCFSTWFTVPLLFLGLIAGGKNAYTLAMNSVRLDEKERRDREEAELNAVIKQAQNKKNKNG